MKIGAADRAVLLNSIDMVSSHIDEVALGISYRMDRPSDDGGNESYPLIVAIVLMELLLDHVTCMLGLGPRQPSRPEALGDMGVGLSERHIDRFAEVLEPALDAIFPAPGEERIGPAWARAWQNAMTGLRAASPAALAEIAAPAPLHPETVPNRAKEI